MEGTATQDLIQEGMAKYEAKAPYPEVIAAFERALNGSKDQKSTALTCLSWLHTLSGDATKGAKAAKEALKLDRTNAQAQYNLVLAMLAGNIKVVREAFQTAMQMSTADAIHEAEGNLQDALERHPDMPAAKKLLAWLSHDH
jgi:tetratricopeptide (TPR) repeat protein